MDGPIESIIGLTIDNTESAYETLPENDVDSPLNINDSLTSALISRDAMSISLKIPSSNKYPDMPVFFESINH